MTNIGYVYNMDTLEFFNREESKYTELYASIICDEDFLNSDADKVDLVEKRVISSINTRLEHAATQCQGLDLLTKFLPKISKDFLTKYFPHWISKVTQILSNAHNNSQELIAVCKTIGALVINCKQVGELDKRVSLYNIKQIIGIIVEKYNKEQYEALLHLLVVLLYYYPESCARFQASYSKIISSCIDEEKKNLVILGAKCYSLLVRAVERLFGNSNKDNSIVISDNSGANCHVFHQINLCNSLYAILDELFKDLVTATSELPYDVQNTSINILQLPDISCHDILEYYTTIENRFTNMCLYLSTLLRAGGNKAKKYSLPNVILQVICTGLSITPKNLQKNNDENKNDILLLILPKLHTGLLNVLEALIRSFQQELVPYASTIQRLLLQNIEWTQEFPQKTFKNVRVQTYKVLSIWLTHTGSLSGFQLLADEFLPHILKDISPPNKNVLLLTTKGQNSTSKSKAKTKNPKEVQNIQNYGCNTDSGGLDSTDTILCSQVLITLQSIISNVNCFLKASFYESIRSTIILLLYEKYVKVNCISTNRLQIQNRLELLRTLRILQTYAHVLTPSPTSYAIQIFGIAISQDSNSEIVEESRLGLAELRHIVYPSAPTLMPLPKQSNLDSSESSSPQLLEINEIIQTSELNSDQKNSNDDCEETIEPPKRQKLDDNLNKETPTESVTESNKNGNDVNNQNDLSDSNDGDEDMIMSFQDVSCCTNGTLVK